MEPVAADDLTFFQFAQLCWEFLLEMGLPADDRQGNHEKPLLRRLALEIGSVGVRVGFVLALLFMALGLLAAITLSAALVFHLLSFIGPVFPR